MNGLAEYSRFIQAAQLERWSLKPGPVIHRQFSSRIDYGLYDSFSVAVMQRDRLFEEYMTSCRNRLPRKGKMRLWRRSDVQDIGLFLFQHSGNIAVPPRDRVANG
jgi:hypothetical protein